MKVGRAIADEPAETAYPALLVSLGSGVSIIKVGGVQACRIVSYPACAFVAMRVVEGAGQDGRCLATPCNLLPLSYVVVS